MPAGIAGLVAIWQLAPDHVWAVPGYACMGTAGLGLAMLIVGFFRKDGGAVAAQTQSSGAGSTNVQAGRDVRIDRTNGD